MQLQHLSTSKYMILVLTIPTGENQTNPFQNGYIWIYPKPEQVIVEGKENLVNYSMGRGIMLKPFCKICGIPISNCANDGLSEAEVAALSDEAKMWHGRASKAAPINLRTINGLDLDVLNTERIDGFNIILPKYVNP